MFSSNSRTLATGSDDGTARLWDAATGQLRTTLNGHTKAVLAAGFSPDGRTVATGSDDGTARLWDAATGQLRITLTDHANSVNALAFSPDGRTLATASEDGTARLWDVGPTDSAAAIAKICQAISRDLSKPERMTYLPASYSSIDVCPAF